MSKELEDRYHIFLKDKEIDKLLKIHFHNINTVLGRGDGIGWYSRFKIIPSVESLMRREMKNRKKKEEYLKSIGYEYRDKEGVAAVV